MVAHTDEATPAKPKKGAYGGHVDIVEVNIESRPAMKFEVGRLVVLFTATRLRTSKFAQESILISKMGHSGLKSHCHGHSISSS